MYRLTSLLLRASFGQRNKICRQGHSIHTTWPLFANGARQRHSKIMHSSPRVLKSAGPPAPTLTWNFCSCNWESFAGRSMNVKDTATQSQSRAGPANFRS